MTPLEKLQESFPVFDIGRVSNGRYYCRITAFGEKVWQGASTMDEAIENALAAVKPSEEVLEYAEFLYRSHKMIDE